MIHTYHYPNPFQAHDAMCEQLMFGETPFQDYDWVHGTEVGLHNVAIHCETMMFDYDLRRLWIPPSRWTMMIRQYIDPSDLDDVLSKVEERMTGKHGGNKARGIAVLRTRQVQGRGTGRNVRRRWGSCMLNMSWRMTPQPTVSLHSRTTYFGYLAMLDMAVAQTFGKQCAQVCGVAPENVQFVWTMDLAQFHGFRSLAWPLMDNGIHPDMISDVRDRQKWSARIANGNQPGYRKALDGLARILASDSKGTLYGDEKFSSFCRTRRRYHTERYGVAYAQAFAGGKHRDVKPFPPLPSLMVSSLTFDALPEGIGDDDDE